MSETKRISSALISVFHKDGLDEIISKLHQEGVKLISTGGTQRFIESLGVPCQAVEELTGYPSILGGRVKTLHPKIFGGILGRREEENDVAQMRSYDIPEIDLVIVENGVLYPLEIKRYVEPRREDVRLFRMLEDIPGYRRGGGGLICMYESVASLTDVDKVIPVKNL